MPGSESTTNVNLRAQTAGMLLLVTATTHFSQL